MIRNGPRWPEMSRKNQEMLGDVRKWSEMVRKWSGSVRIWSKIFRNGPWWSEMVKNVQDGPRFQDGQICLKHWKKIHFAYTRPERNLFPVFFSFLSVQIFPCGQVDKLFQMSHGAISPSLMVLFSFSYSVRSSCRSEQMNKRTSF